MIRKIAEPLTHNIKQLGFSGLRGFGSRSNFFQRWIKTRSENPTVSYCQPLKHFQKQNDKFAMTTDDL